MLKLSKDKITKSFNISACQTPRFKPKIYMPELPEVETICRQLKQNLIGKIIVNVDIFDNRLIKNISVKELSKAIVGTKVNEIIRRGKALIIVLNNGKFLILHLRISGWLILSRKKEDFSRVKFVFNHGLSLQFCDSRALGQIQAVDDWKSVPLLKEMGPDPLEISEKEFIEIFKKKKIKIKPLLMDQKIIAGVGNIYAQEALFAGRIHPERRADTLTSKELSKLYRCLKEILNEAIKKHGSSIDTYRRIDGADGNYAAYHLVYRKPGQPCPICKAPLIGKEIAGRRTCFCSACQK